MLWYNKKLMDKFGYTVPTTWQEWAALGQKVATEHPGYIIGNTGDSYSHWIYLWGDQCPLSRCRRTAASASTRRIRTAPGWPACSIR